MTWESVMQGCAIALTAAACLGLVILISGMVAEVLGDIRDRRRREAAKASSSAGGGRGGGGGGGGGGRAPGGGRQVAARAGASGRSARHNAPRPHCTC